MFFLLENEKSLGVCRFVDKQGETKQEGGYWKLSPEGREGVLDVREREFGSACFCAGTGVFFF